MFVTLFVHSWTGMGRPAVNTRPVRYTLGSVHHGYARLDWIQHGYFRAVLTVRGTLHVLSMETAQDERHNSWRVIRRLLRCHLASFTTLLVFLTRGCQIRLRRRGVGIACGVEFQRQLMPVALRTLGGA